MLRTCCLQEPNIRYLALENLTRLALVPEVLESIREHQVCATVHHCRLSQFLTEVQAAHHIIPCPL